MDVHLLVYDLSQGLARNMSMGILGFQLDAIYHTSIELSGREYVYDGGIVDIVPGSSHLGRPLERLFLGKTELPMDVIVEYLDSLRPIFTAAVSLALVTSERSRLTLAGRPMISSSITAIIFQTHFPPSSLARGYQITSCICHKLC